MELLETPLLLHLRELFVNQPLVPSCLIDELEEQEFSWSKIYNDFHELEKLITSIDNIFFSDYITDYTRVLSNIEIINLTNDKFKLKFTIS